MSGFACSDVRDRVYGVLKMIEWTHQEGEAIVPNHEISPMSLALTVISIMENRKFSDVKKICEALGLNEHNQEVKTHLQNRLRKAGTQFSQTIRDRPWLGHIKFVAPIFEVSFGHLAVNLGTHELPLRHSKINATIQSWLEDPSQVPDTSKNHVPMQLKSGTRVAALACHGACSGDVLLAAESGCLVLRLRNTPSHFQVVGQAILVNGFEEIVAQKQYAKRRLQLLCGGEDALLLEAMKRGIRHPALLERLPMDLPATRSLACFVDGGCSVLK